MYKKYCLGYLLILLTSCIDYIDISSPKDRRNFRPIIERKHLVPSQEKLFEPMNIGGNCKELSFKLLPIIDYNKEDKLYCLWFFDKALVKQSEVIEPKGRQDFLPEFILDNTFLDEHFQGKLPKEFFDRYHMVEFFVSDRPYSIPESRYIDENTDYHYWTFRLSDDPC